MIKNISRICSFLLLFFIAALSLSEFNIVIYSEQLKNILSFLTLILIMFSSVTNLITNKSGFFKFISILIIIALVVGGVISILKPGLNIFIYICLVSISIFSLFDMFYKTV